jgi:hypothetical protein
MEPNFRLPLRLEQVPLPEVGHFSHAMLDPALKLEQLEHHELKIREWKEKRVICYARMKSDPKYRQAIYEKCRRDPLFFILMFVNTYDDRLGKVVPFILFDFQEEKMLKPYLNMVRTEYPHRSTCGIAKSRAIGYTWVSMALRVWAWMFIENWSILIGGENRDDVDDGGMNASQQSLFGKMRFIIDQLHPQMKQELLGPEFFKESQSNSYNKRNFMRNPLKPLNIMNGKQMGAMFGRGRRYSEVFADEVAYCEEMENADVSLRQTTNRFFFGSTPKGKGNFFYDVMHGALKVVKIYCWWAENPHCDLDWYNAQREHMTDDAIAQELDISFSRSAGSLVLHEMEMDKWFTMKAEFDPNLPLTIVMDPGFTDNFACIWAQWDQLNGEGRIVDFVCTKKRSIDWIVPFITGVVPEATYRGDPWPHEYNQVERELIERHQGWVTAQGGVASLQIMGDAAGNAKTVNTGRSAYDELDQYGVYVDGIKIRDDKLAIEHMNLMMRFIKIWEPLMDQRNGPKEESPTFGEVCTQWRYPKKKPGAVQSPDRPVHDVFSHGGDCLKMWCDTLCLPEATQMPAQAGDLMRKRTPDMIEPSHEDAAGPWRSR